MNISLQVLYQIICSAFCVIAVLSNIISAKMIPFPLFEDFYIPAGLISYPLTFLLSDLVTEIYGAPKAKMMVYTAFAMNLLGFGIIEAAVLLPSMNAESHIAFKEVLGSSGLRIFASLAAFLTAQLVDIQLYTLIKRWTGHKHLWLRNNGSTCASQIVDTIMVDMIYLYWGLGMSLAQVAPIMVFSYCYKALFSIATTPLFYLLVFLVRKNFGESHEPSKEVWT